MGQVALVIRKAESNCCESAGTINGVQISCKTAACLVSELGIILMYRGSMMVVLISATPEMKKQKDNLKKKTLRFSNHIFSVLTTHLKNMLKLDFKITKFDSRQDIYPFKTQ